jgi:hypothetical protein
MQESGIAVSRSDITIVPITIDGNTVPPGFMSYVQAKKVTPEVLDFNHVFGGLLVASPELAIDAAIKNLDTSGSYRDAEADFSILMEHLGALTDDQANKLVETAASNGQVYDAARCAGGHIPTVLRRFPNAGSKASREFLIKNCQRYARGLDDLQ